MAPSKCRISPQSEQKYVPNCCSEHRTYVAKYREKLDVSRWSFPSEFAKVKNHLSKYSSPADGKQGDDKTLQQMKLPSMIQDFSTNYDSGSKEKKHLNKTFKSASEKISNLVKFKVPEAIVPEKLDSQLPFLGYKETKDLSTSQNLKDNEKALDKPGIYLNFLNRLKSQEEAEEQHPDNDSEDNVAIQKKLNKLVKNFCEFTEQWVQTEGADEDLSAEKFEEQQREWTMQPEKLFKLFRVHLCRHSFCPYFAQTVQDAQKMPQSRRKPSEQPKLSAESKAKKAKSRKLQQVYYMPPSTRFREEVEDSKTALTEDEKEFMESLTAKIYFQYLRSVGEKPAEILENLKERYEKAMLAIAEKRKTEYM